MTDDEEGWGWGGYKEYPGFWRGVVLPLIIGIAIGGPAVWAASVVGVKFLAAIVLLLACVVALGFMYWFLGMVTIEVVRKHRPRRKR